MKITDLQPAETPSSGVGFGAAAGGDLAGALPAPAVTGIQTIPVSSTAPTDGQELTYVAADAQWEPRTPPPAPAFAPPAITLGAAAAAGSAATVIRSDATIVAFTAAIPLADAGSGSPGSAPHASREDHGHPLASTIWRPVMAKDPASGIWYPAVAGDGTAVMALS